VSALTNFHYKTLLMKQLNKLLLLIILISAVTTVKSQISYDFGFKRFDSIPVFDSLGNPLDFPWTGGLNSVHFNEIDMNLDGKKDLLVFDSHGDKKYTFITGEFWDRYHINMNRNMKISFQI